MGKKRETKGMYLFLHGACLFLMLLLSAGCATTSNFQKSRQGQKHLDLAEKLISEGDYDGALNEKEIDIGIEEKKKEDFIRK